MDRNTFISSFKRNIINRVPKIFTLFMVLVVVIECCISCFSPYIAANSEYMDIQSRVFIVQTEELDRDILILGDSSAGVSINPNRLAENTGLSCVNLATRVGTTVAANYFLFQDYLETNNPPEYIILMRGFHHWPGKQNGSTNELLLTIFPERMLELLAHPELAGNNYGELLRLIPGYLLPSQQNRWAIRKTIKKIIQDKKPITEILTENKREITERKQQLLGEVPYNISNQGMAEEREQELINQLNFVNDNTFDTSEWSVYYLEQLITLAEQNGTVVFVCMPTVRKELYDEEAHKDYLHATKIFIGEVCSSYDNMVLLTDDFYYVTVDQIRDHSNHLTAEESIIFTDMLAQRLLEFQDSH